MLKLTSKNFEKEVFKSKKPVVVDFSAAWCGYCKVITKIINELIKEGYGEKVKFCEIDIGKHTEFARKHNVTSLPTILFISKGKEKARKNGRTTKTEFVKLITLMSKG